MEYVTVSWEPRSGIPSPSYCIQMFSELFMYFPLKNRNCGKNINPIEVKTWHQSDISLKSLGQKKLITS